MSGRRGKTQRDVALGGDGAAGVRRVVRTSRSVWACRFEHPQNTSLQRILNACLELSSIKETLDQLAKGGNASPGQPAGNTAPLDKAKVSQRPGHAQRGNDTLTRESMLMGIERPPSPSAVACLAPPSSAHR